MVPGAHAWMASTWHGKPDIQGKQGVGYKEGLGLYYVFIARVTFKEPPTGVDIRTACHAPSGLQEMFAHGDGDRL